jgi:phage baseplate assembly protein W
MAQFLGTSLAFPLRPNNRGGIATVTGAEAVEDSIRAIIETIKGSHLFNPFLGLPSFVFQPIQDTAAVSEVIKEALIDGDDRIDPDTLFVEVGIEDSGFMPVAITYSIRGDATERTLHHGFRVLS